MTNSNTVTKETTSEAISGDGISGINSKHFSPKTIAAILVMMNPDADDALLQINFPIFDRALNPSFYWG